MAKRYRAPFGVFASIAYNHRRGQGFKPPWTPWSFCSVLAARTPRVLVVLEKWWWISSTGEIAANMIWLVDGTAVRSRSNVREA